jgi:hypothetical protein
MWCLHGDLSTILADLPNLPLLPFLPDLPFLPELPDFTPMRASGLPLFRKGLGISGNSFC